VKVLDDDVQPDPPQVVVANTSTKQYALSVPHPVDGVSRQGNLSDLTQAESINTPVRPDMWTNCDITYQDTNSYHTDETRGHCRHSPALQAVRKPRISLFGGIASD